MNNDGGCTIDTCPLSMATVHYDPSLVGNTFYLTLFAGTFVVQAVQTWKYKTWSYSFSVMSGLVLEVVGYLGRVQMHYNPFDANPFLIYLIGLTIGPVFFNAAIYLTLSRIIVHYGVRYCWLTPKRISITFMTCDFIALVLQAAGGAIADTASTSKGSDTGTHILVAGLGFQVLSLLFFIGVSCYYALLVTRLRQGKDVFVQSPSRYWRTVHLNSQTKRHFNLFLVAFSFATIFILVRSTFRVAELWKGFDSRLTNDEVLFMLLEGTMITLAVGLLTFFHPGTALKDEWKDSGWVAAKVAPNDVFSRYEMSGV
ncbi:RTA1-domain-containing protein [Mollisia scopiformis]|uniref:RTA1-domain-containing protein n=1 Tax=Mollisia scopiformis TaxID=149040 RepID=A0A132BAF8_MOLSC|nr:RTA1-domain-containing protein [Mollisia scopiformis]KUJ09395.1 RTA1-domain-containing protein [Mollisia scopiformis]